MGNDLWQPMSLLLMIVLIGIAWFMTRPPGGHA